MTQYIPNAKIGFVIHSAIILLSETAIMKLSSNTFSWVLRILLVILIFYLFKLLFRKSRFTQVHFFEGMLFINVLFLLAALNTKFEYLPSFVNYIILFLMISCYSPIFKEISKYNQLIIEGYDPEFDRNEFIEKVPKWFKYKS